MLGRGEALDFDARAADRLGERLEVADVVTTRSFCCARTVPAPSRGERQDQREHYAAILVKIDFGIMQCTPLRMSTTCETRQSPAIDTSA